MSELPLNDAIKILLSEKKKADVKLEKAYDSYCLFPNEKDQTDWDTYSALSTALDMAIKALEQEPCEDAVSRAEALEAIKDYINTVGVLDGYTDTQEVLHILKRLPSVTPKQRTGKWLKENRGGVEYAAVCDQCGDYTFWSERSSYCPNCGAKMNGGD